MLNSGIQPPEFYRELWRTIADGQEWRGEFINRTKDGALYWELASISPFWDQVAPLRITWRWARISPNRKRVEDALKITHHFLRGS